MKVFSFVGPSGSGKSYRAAWVAHKNGIEFMIDDGLFIQGNNLLAGVSAKKEKTKVGSIRRALFRDSAHACEVREAIRRFAPPSILILGTSDAMIDEIVQVLELPAVDEHIRIEDVAAPEEIEKAKHVRRTEGKHVIPVPTFEIKKDFSGYFLDTLHIFNKSKKSNDMFRTTKTVVRPTFSYLGSYHIADRVITAISQHEALQIPDVSKVLYVSLKSAPQGLYIFLDISIRYGGNARTAGALVQRAVLNAVENYTALNVLGVDVTVKSVTV